MLVPAMGWPDYGFGWGLRMGQGLDACDHNRFLFLFLFVCAPLVLGPCPPSHPFRFVDVVSFKVIWGRALVHLNAIKEEGKGMGRKKTVERWTHYHMQLLFPLSSFVSTIHLCDLSFYTHRNHDTWSYIHLSLHSMYSFFLIARLLLEVPRNSRMELRLWIIPK